MLWKVLTGSAVVAHAYKPCYWTLELEKSNFEAS